MAPPFMRSARGVRGSARGRGPPSRGRRHGLSGISVTRIAERVREHFPHLKILPRCRDRPHYWELRKLGCIAVFRETFGSVYEAGVESLKQLGFRSYTAHRLARR